VVLVDFWTYTCVNCIRTLPYLEGWYRRYHRDGLEIVGVHTPEFPFEREASNVADAINQFGITYPVVQDNDRATWDAYQNQYWPADYLIDSGGHVRYVHFGEGDYSAAQKAIRDLLAAAGRAPHGPDARVHAQKPSRGLRTPESYLGAARAERFVGGLVRPGTRAYHAVPPGSLPPNALSYGGRWTITNDAATGDGDSTLELNFDARRVFLVLGSPDRPRALHVSLDGRPVPHRLAGTDVHGGVAEISRQRLYNLVSLPNDQAHVLTLHFARGISGYAFTFG
jgi:thiol-disulfide isomerase/thioredoxin